MIQNVTYSHEHVTFGMSVDGNAYADLHDAKNTTEEFLELAALGVKNVVSLTPINMDRDIEILHEVEKASGLRILCSTGYLKEPYLPQNIYQESAQDIARLFISEIVTGIAGTSKRATVIGEIGTSKNIMTATEEKVFVAAAQAQLETGVPICTHSTLGTYGFEQIQFFKKQGVDLQNVCIGHSELSGDIDKVLRMLGEGSYLSFDTIGKIEYLPDERRVEMLVEIERHGFIEQMLLSMDICHKAHLKKQGGIGYAYLLTHFVPELLKAGMKEDSIEKMLVHNPKKFFKSALV